MMIINDIDPGFNARPARSYEIETAAKTLIVLEALEGIAFEPVSLSTVVGRTGFTRDFCYRALRTLEIRGYAASAAGKWSVGKRISRLAASIARNRQIV